MPEIQVLESNFDFGNEVHMGCTSRVPVTLSNSTLIPASAFPTRSVTTAILPEFPAEAPVQGFDPHLKCWSSRLGSVRGLRCVRRLEGFNWIVGQAWSGWVGGWKAMPSHVARPFSV